MWTDRHIAWLLILGLIFLTACSGAVGLSYSVPPENTLSAADINAAAERAATARPPATSPPERTSSDTPPTPAEEPIPSPTAGRPKINPRVEVPDNLFVNWLIPWDGIRPIYDPEFVNAADAPLDDSELVIGISLNGESKAYSISVLRSREMVNDELGGIPTLVTW